jgi:hypothetical protein
MASDAKISDVLTQLETLPPQPLTAEISGKLSKIKAICDEKYSNQHFFGNAALNRMMLLDPDIAQLLTPDVIRYVFSNPPSPENKINRNSTPGGIHLKDAIKFGFADGLAVIKLIPNNQYNYGPEQNKAQQSLFEKHTTQIIANIFKANGQSSATINEPLSMRSLGRQFDSIRNIVGNQKSNGNSDNLLFVPNYTLNDLELQVKTGFNQLCQLIGADPGQHTLDSFTEKLLQSPEAFLKGDVAHLFFDRAHMLVALHDDSTINIGGIDCNYRDILQNMVYKLSKNPDHYPQAVKEQMALRLSLVENYLATKFPQEGLNYAKDATPYISIRVDHADLLESSGFNNSLAKFSKFVDHMEMGYSKEAAKKYLNMFEQAKSDFVNGRIELPNFEKSCFETIRLAEQDPGINSKPSLLARIENIANNVVKFLTMGHMEIDIPTDSRKRVNHFKEGLQNIRQEESQLQDTHDETMSKKL